MFFSSDLLIFKRGKFNLIWLAATRGEKFLTKNDLKKVDIHFACSEVMEYIMRQQKIKLSLYLSSQLTFGLCVIYHKKIEKLLNDLQDLYKKSFITFTFNTHSDKLKGNKRIKGKDNLNTSILDDFGALNASFGMITNFERNTSKENEMDLANQVAYLNQARFEDITLMEYDAGTNNLKNQLENDLEPMNVELLQELLGAVDPSKIELDTFLNKPFYTEIQEIHNDKENCLFRDVDLDRTEYTEERGQTPGHRVINTSSVADIKDIHEVDLDKIETIQENKIEIAEKSLLTESVLNLIDIDIPDRVLQPLPNENTVGENECQLEQIPTKKPKVSHTIEVVPADRSSRKIDLTYHKPVKTAQTITRNTKRKALTRSLIIDAVTKIPHQSIRENMNRQCATLVDKNAVFPNPFVTKSLRAQIACSTTSLFEFPGTFTILKCPRMLRFWMDRKERCRNAQPLLEELEHITEQQPEVQMDYLDWSIEKPREANSSMNTNGPVDSFTFGSDNLQKSIRPSCSFEMDKTVSAVVLEDANPAVPDELDLKETHNIVDIDIQNYSVVDNRSIMMPIMEEGLCGSFEINQNEDIPVPVPNKVMVSGKSDVWKIIQDMAKVELGKSIAWDEIRIGFGAICPNSSTKKLASMVFLTLLRLGKYNKIRIFQENPLSEIFIGLPMKDI